MTSETLRLILPQWQGGNNPPYYLDPQLFSSLSPGAREPVRIVPVELPTTEPLPGINGIAAKPSLIRRLNNAAALIEKHDPNGVVILSGDCLVSLTPFAHLLDKFGDKLDVLWIDSHPDMQTAERYPNAHVHVLGALVGTGDNDLVAHVKTKLNPSKIMITGIHAPLPYEAEYLIRHNITTLTPEQVRNGADEVLEWIAKEKIAYLAIHIDLDVLDPSLFRSILFVKPGRGKHDFGDIAEGKLATGDVLNLIAAATTKTVPVGLTIAEHLLQDMLNLKNMLSELPLLKQDEIQEPDDRVQLWLLA